MLPSATLGVGHEREKMRMMAGDGDDDDDGRLSVVVRRMAYMHVSPSELRVHKNSIGIMFS